MLMDANVLLKRLLVVHEKYNVSKSTMEIVQ